jgi:uncharacterized protein YecE (DUF72 family)
MSAPAESTVLVGTSGYSFPDWVGPFYPAGMKSGDFLGFYARHFDVVEVNSTYYRIPQPRMLEQMEKKTPDHFRFVVKLHQSMTHEGSLDPASYRDFLSALEPLKAAGKYDGLLAQFPWAFRFGVGSLDHLRALRERLGDEPLFVEFRHVSWTDPSVPGRLREQRLGFCAVDEPDLPGLMPAVTHVTAEDAYVRLHGRNARNWWARPGVDRKGADRYDYEYSPAELGEWVKKIANLATQARRTYVFFNNCHAGQAARNAALMKELLREQQFITGSGGRP